MKSPLTSNKPFSFCIPAIRENNLLSFQNLSDILPISLPFVPSKSCICHSYENTRGTPKQFPNWVPPRPTSRKDLSMNSTARSANCLPSSHCTFRTTSGRFCRLPVADSSSSLCFRHALDRKNQNNATNLASSLTGDSEEFQTAVGIHASLSALFKLLAEDRISARRAAVLAYIANLLLRTIPLVHSELDRDSASPCSKNQIDFGDLPRPKRDNLPVTLEAQSSQQGVKAMAVKD
jgi:hypothetical protein